LIWTRPLRAGIADYRFITVLSAVSHGMSTVLLPEWMPNDGEFVAVRVLCGASRTRHAPLPPVTCSVRRLYAGCHERTLVRR